MPRKKSKAHLVEAPILPIIDYLVEALILPIIDYLVQALILPIIDYPPASTHALGRNQLRRLPMVQKATLRLATNQRHPYTMDTKISMNKHPNQQT